MAFQWSPQQGENPEQAVREFFQQRTDYYASPKRKKPQRISTQRKPSLSPAGSPARLSPLPSGRSSPSIGAPLRSSNQFVESLSPNDVGIREIAQLAKQMNSPVRIEGVQEATNMVLRAAQGTTKDQFAWLANLESMDQLLSTAYEYIAAHCEVSKASSKGGCSDDTQLHTQRLVCEFGSAFFKLLLECSREGEKPLQDMEGDDGLMQVVPQLVIEVTQKLFSEHQSSTIERELGRVLGCCDFSLEHSVQLRLKKKAKQRSAVQMLELTTVAMAPHLASLNVDELIHVALANIKELIGCKGAWVLMVSNGSLWHHPSVSGFTIPVNAAGIGGTAAISREVVSLRDANKDSRFNRFVDSLGPVATSSLVAMPLMDPATGECIAVLEASNKTDQPTFSSEDLAYLQQVGELIGCSIGRIRSVEKTNLRLLMYDKLQKHQVTLFAAAHLESVQTVAEMAAAILCEELQAAACCVFVLEPQKSWIWRAGSCGGSSEPNRKAAAVGFSSESISVVTQSIATNKTLVVPEIRQCQFFHKEIDTMDQTVLPANILCSVLKHRVAEEYASGVSTEVARGAFQLINKLDGCAFTTADIEFADILALTVATAMSTVIDRMTLSENIERLDAAATAQKEFTLRLDRGAPLAAVVDSVSSIFDVEECSLFLHMDGEQQLERTSRDNVGAITEATIKLEKDHPEGLVAQCLSTRQAISVEDAQNCGVFNRRIDRAALNGGETRNLLAVPLRTAADADTIGVLQLVNGRNGRKFSSADEKLLNLMANTAAAAVVNGKLLGSLRWSQSLAMKLVNSACHFSGEVGQEVVLQQAARGACDLTQADQVYLFLLEDSGVKSCSFRLACSTDDSKPSHVVNVTEEHFGLNNMPSWGLAGHSCIKREIVMSNNPQKDPRYNNMVDSVLGFQPAGMLAVPIEQPISNADRLAENISNELTSPTSMSKKAMAQALQAEAYGSRAIGSIEVVRRKGNRKGGFVDADVKTLVAFAQLVAVAIQTSRECAERKEGELYARNLQSLVQESSCLLLELSQSELCKTAADMVMKHTPADQVAIFTVAASDMEEDEASRTLQLTALDSTAEPFGEMQWPEEGLPNVVARMGKGYVGGAAKQKIATSTTSLNEDTLTDDQADTLATGESAHSVMCVPFMDSSKSGEARGVIQVHRKSRAGFTQHDEDFVSFLGTLLAVGCSNCDRFMPLDACHTKSDEMQAVMHGLSLTAQHSYRNLPMQVIMRCQELFGVADANLYIYQEENPSVLLRYSIDHTTEAGTKMKMTPVQAVPLWGVAGECVIEDKPIILNEVDVHSDKSMYDREIDGPTLAKRLLCVPMHLANSDITVNGCISLMFTEGSEERFNEYSAYMLSCLATHISNLIYMWNTVASKRAKDSGQGIVPNRETMEELLDRPKNAPTMAGEFVTNELEAFELIRHLSMQKGIRTTRAGIWGKVQSLGDICRRKMSMEQFEEWFDEAFEPTGIG